MTQGVVYIGQAVFLIPEQSVWTIDFKSMVTKIGNSLFSFRLVELSMVERKYAA